MTSRPAPTRTGMGILSLWLAISLPGQSAMAEGLRDSGYGDGSLVDDYGDFVYPQPDGSFLDSYGRPYSPAIEGTNLELDLLSEEDAGESGASWERGSRQEGPWDTPGADGYGLEGRDPGFASGTLDALDGYRDDEVLSEPADALPPEDRLSDHQEARPRGTSIGLGGPASGGRVGPREEDPAMYLDVGSGYLELNDPDDTPTRIQSGLPSGQGLNEDSMGSERVGSLLEIPLDSPSTEWVELQGPQQQHHPVEPSYGGAVPSEESSAVPTGLIRHQDEPFYEEALRDRIHREELGAGH